MKFLIVFAAAVGLAFASPSGFLQNTVEVQSATQNFVREYNRLAELSALAPDIHMYNEANQFQGVEAPSPHSSHPRQRAPNPLQGVTVYSFSTNLGSGSQPHHQLRTFHQPQAVHRAPPQVRQQAAPVHRAVPQVRQQAAPVHRAVPQVHQQVSPVHRAITHVQQQAVARQPTLAKRVQPAPVKRWEGPLAHTVPAGVDGLPQQVAYTPDVAAARNAHFSVLVNAYEDAAATRQQHVTG